MSTFASVKQIIHLSKQIIMTIFTFKSNDSISAKELDCFADLICVFVKTSLSMSLKNDPTGFYLIVDACEFDTLDKALQFITLANLHFLPKHSSFILYELNFTKVLKKD